MAWFSGIKNTYKKSEAAVIVQNLLEHQSKAGQFDLDLAANRTLYSLKSIDERLLETAANFLATEVQRFEQENGELLDELESAFQDTP